jgi:hypothetical protein
VQHFIFLLSFFAERVSSPGAGFIGDPVDRKTWGTLMKSMNLDPLTPSFELP